MKVTRDDISALTVRKVAPGEIRVGSETITGNVLLTTEGGISGWSAKDAAQLVTGDFAPILDTRPDIIVLGTGWSAVIPPRELIFEMARRAIGFEFMDTPAACRTFNILINEGRRAAAALIVREETGEP